MAYTVDMVSERETVLGVVGKVLQRTYEVSGVRNTLGEPEVYRVLLKGTYNDGSVRYEVLVQRKNGGFVMLDRNRHSTRCSQVFSALHQILPEYKEACRAI